MMGMETYSVLDANGEHIAYHMELSHALLLIEALMREYYQVQCLTYRIMREQNDCEEVVK